DLVPVRLAGVVRKVLRDPLQDQRARVVGAVERMPEAEELLLALEHRAYLGWGLLRRAPALEQAHGGLVRAAVQRPAERGDRADDCAGETRARARDHPRREGRRVQLVLGV